MITFKKVQQRVENDATTNGYHLNSDPMLLEDLLQGLKRNEERYGYPSCPCRLASGRFKVDRDIICPCDYRDIDVVDHGACYCTLFVRADVHSHEAALLPIPERRPSDKQTAAYDLGSESIKAPSARVKPPKIGFTLWYCQQCGYVCFREDPPYLCPICKAKKERFVQLDLCSPTP